MKKSSILKLIFIVMIVILLIAYITISIIVKHNKNVEQIPVIMYHNVVLDEDFKNQPETLTVSMFKKHLDYYKENGYQTLTLDEFYDWKKGKKSLKGKAVLLTFDDGYYSFQYLVEPVLKEYDMHAACFVIGANTPKETPVYDPNKYGTVGINQIREHSKYVEYGSHTYGMHVMKGNQKKILTVSKKETEEDVNKMKEIYDFKYLVYPYNTPSKDMVKTLKENNYKLAFWGEYEKATKGAEDYRVPRIAMSYDFDKFKKIFETDYYNNRYGNGLFRKIMVTIERKIGMRLF